MSGAARSSALRSRSSGASPLGSRPAALPAVDRALVLRRRPYGESSLIVQLATERHGRVHLLAKGAFRPKSGYCGVLDLFDTLEVRYHVPRAGGGAGSPAGVSGLANLVGATLVTRRRALTHALWRYRAGLFALELFELACHPGPDEDLPFALLETTLDALASAAAPAAARPIATAYVLRLLALLGLEPALQRCASCGEAAPPVTADGRRAAFSAASGGRLCLRCARDARAAGRRVGTLPIEVLARARELLEDADTLDEAADVSASAPVPARAPASASGLGGSPVRSSGVEPRSRASEDPAAHALVDFVQRFLEYHLEYRPRVRLEDL